MMGQGILPLFRVCTLPIASVLLALAFICETYTGNCTTAIKNIHNKIATPHVFVVVFSFDDLGIDPFLHPGSVAAE